MLCPHLLSNFAIKDKTSFLAQQNELIPAHERVHRATHEKPALKHTCGRMCQSLESSGPLQGAET